jgi:hypothetical protein
MGTGLEIGDSSGTATQQHRSLGMSYPTNVRVVDHSTGIVFGYSQPVNT